MDHAFATDVLNTGFECVACDGREDFVANNWRELLPAKPAQKDVQIAGGLAWKGLRGNVKRIEPKSDANSHAFVVQKSRFLWADFSKNFS